MTTPTPECPACRVSMERGFVYDVGRDGRILATHWVEGPPEKTLLRGLNVKGRRSLDTVTFRCPKCGWLIWFAPETGSPED